jgi:arylsulfatase A-like enzyme
VSEVFRTVERLRGEGEEILLLVGSDHGQETIGNSVDLDSWLTGQGLEKFLEDGDVAVAGQGTAALLYATDRGRGPLLGVLGEMSRAEWAAEVIEGERLADQGFAAHGGAVAAVNMARQGDTNPYGVAGHRWVVAEAGKPAAIGSGQHGGWGPDEIRPFLMMNDGGRSTGTMQRPTCITDIAPTIAHFLGLPGEGFDGKCLTS